MIIIDYNTGETLQDKLWQYDYGETLRIQGGNLQKAQEVHFSLNGTGGTTVTRIGATKDGVTDVVIPDSMLENNDSEIDYLIYVFLYNRDSTSGETTKRFVLNVRSRPKPEHTGGTDGNAFGEVIEEVNKSAERAEVAERKAKEYATQTKEDAQNTADDRKEVERQVESVSNIDEKVQKVNEYKEQAQTSATKALLSEQESKKAEQTALQAQAGAETAENSAEQHATQVRGDKAEVDRLSAQVREDKVYVEQTAQNFALKAQQTLADVNNAGQTQTERVQSAGTTAKENIQTAQNTATKGIETAKTEAVKTVQTEGTKQVQAVQGVAQEIIADREQIAKNKTDIAELRHTKANAIVENASGTLINIKDSAEEKLQDLKVFGKSTQDGEPTPEAPQEIKSIGKLNSDKKYEVAVQMTGKNLLGGRYYYTSYANHIGHITGYDKEPTFPYVEVSEPQGVGKIMPCRAGMTYTFSVTNPNDNFSIGIVEYASIEDANNHKNKIDNVIEERRNKTSYIAKKNGILLCFLAGKWTDGTTTIHTCTDTELLQVEYGTEATTYEPHKEQSVKLSLSEQIRGIADYKDEVTKDGVVRNFKELAFDGTENWETWGANNTEEGHIGFFIYTKELDKQNIFEKEIICNMLKTVDSNYGGRGVGICLYIDERDRYNSYFSISLKNTMLEDVSTDEKAIQSFKKFLAQKKEEGKQFKIIARISQVIKEELPEEVKQQLSALHSNYPTTVLTNDANAEMEVEYVADTKNYIDNKLKELVIANMQNTANLLSLMPTSVQAEMIENDTNRILEEVTQ